MLHQKLLSLLLSACLLLSLFVCPAAAEETSVSYIQIDIEGFGTIVAELYPDAAPITVANFLRLVDEGFYNGLTFHRIISGFMIQGGDPNHNGTGGSAQTIKGEFSANGIDNPIKHVRGVLSMARARDNDSASSQFFIMHQDAPHLDGQYAAFGRVLSGMDVVDLICSSTPVADQNGTVPFSYQPVISAIRRIDSPDAAVPMLLDSPDFIPTGFTPTDYVQMEIEGYGTIVAGLYGDLAPITVANFLRLVDEGFYDGVTFHRIIYGFMMQGGAPAAGVPAPERIKGEFSANGVDNPILHIRGVLSMARARDNDSASSQFFIMHKDAPHLDGQYAAFGQVVSGMEVVDLICRTARVIDGNGTVQAGYAPVVTTIRRVSTPDAQ